MTYAFIFDASACTGCKACQVACKDKNNLPKGILWRRVYEISGGSWHKAGKAWQTDVFAYNLSLACNHCEHAICAGVCPVNAYTKREDGLVILDIDKCIGCRYCSWACPYGAPQYNPAAGHMTKCNFCVDNLEAGEPPACVAACPMRVLDYGEQEAILSQTGGRAEIYPMQQVNKREPNVFIQPHQSVKRGAAEGTVANWEEIAPHKEGKFDEAPLVAFSLLTQMAVGAFWTIELIYLAFSSITLLYNHPFDSRVTDLPARLTLTSVLTIGPLLGIALLVSFLHLGTPRNAWRALANLGNSWLSREILFVGLFGIGWALTAFWQLTQMEFLRVITGWLTAGLGAGLIYCMVRVYRFKTIPAWYGWRVMVGFFASALLLGRLLVISILALESLRPANNTYFADSFQGAGWGVVVLLGVQLALALSARQNAHRGTRRLRLGLILTGIGLGAALTIVPSSVGIWLIFPIFIIASLEEVLGRWLFYTSRERLM